MSEYDQTGSINLLEVQAASRAREQRASATRSARPASHRSSQPVPHTLNLEGGVARTTWLIGSGTMVSRLLGFVKIAVIAQTLGIVGTPGGDAYTTALIIPNTIYGIIAGGLLNAVLLPQVVRSASHSDGGQAFINRLVTLAATILLGIAVVATLASPLLTNVVGITLTDDMRALVTAITYWVLPQVFFYGIYSVLGEILNARGMFGAFTWAPVLNNIVSILGLVFLGAMYGFAETRNLEASQWTPDMIAILGGTSTLGIIVQAVILMFFWRRAGLRFRFDFRFRGSGLGKTGKLAHWTFAMLLVTTIGGIIQTNIQNVAAGQFYPSTTAANAAWTLFILPQSVIALSITMSYYTRMSAHARDNNRESFVRDYSTAMRTIAMFMVLASAGLVALGPALATLLSPNENTIAVGILVSAYGLGLVPFSLLVLTQRAFYSLEDTKTPFFTTLGQSIFVALGGFLTLWFVPIQYITASIALVISTASFLQFGVSVWLLRRRLGTLDARRIVSSLGKFAAAGGASLAAGLGIMLLLGGYLEGGWPVRGFGSALLSIALAGTAMVAAYVLTLFLMRSQELRDTLKPLIARIRRSS